MIFLILIINLSFLIFAYINIFSVMVRTYLVINFVTIINPGLILFFFNLAHNRYIPETDNYNLALIYNFFYNILLVFGYKIFFQIEKPKLLIFNFLKKVKNRVVTNKNALIKANFYVYLVSLFANGFLFITGNFRMNELAIGYSGPFLQILKSISSVNFLSLILFSQIRYYSQKIDKKFNYLYAGICFFSIYFAIQSGSRSQLIINLFVCSLGYWKAIKKNLKLTISILILSFPLFILLFPLISSFRNSGYDISQTFILLSTKLNSQSITDTIAEVFIGRFNYLQTLSRVIYQVNNFGPEGYDIYLNNIIGLIPRIIWPNKPLISDFAVDTGYLLEMINEIDFDSSLGLGVSAEAYYRLGYYGLLIALVQSYLFSFFSKNFFVKKNIISMSIFIFFIITILLRDGYFALIPGIVWDFITCFIFIFFLILFTKKSSKSLSKT